jgi:hypothetical protein
MRDTVAYNQGHPVPKNPVEKLLALVVTVLLILGILPSWTALSETYREAFPAMARISGPLNPLKFGIPLLVLWTLLRAKQKAETRPILLFWLAALSVGSLSTLIAAVPCAYPPYMLREWMSIGVGILGASAWALLPTPHARAVLTGWLGLVAMSIALDAFFPEAIDSLYTYVFDPETRSLDVLETGHKLLTGVFGRQSLAKLMAWLPWLTLPLVAQKPKALGGALIATALWSGLILATSQRGPTLAAFGALCLFGVHQLWHRRSLKLAGAFLALVSLSIVTLVVTVPDSLWKPRFYSLIAPPPDASPSAFKTAYDNAQFRTRMTALSLESIGTHPLGNACISEEIFQKHGLFPAHSHSLILEQFRTRGWIWGAVHLALWILAGLALWRRADAVGASLFAGWSAVMISGLVDHPWSVLNHSLVLGIYLWLGIEAWIRPRRGEIRPPRAF